MPILHPWGKMSDGRFVHIESVAPGSTPNLACPQCSGVLIPVQGTILAWHFRHQAENILCNYEPESTLHLVAKQKICEMLQLSYPRQHVGFNSTVFPVELGKLLGASQEVTLANGAIRADVVAQFDSEQVAVEVFVTHRVNADKIETFEKYGIAAFEIDLSYYSLANKSEREWIDDILHGALRYWLYPPKCVRDAEELLRQAWIAEREREAKEAREAQQRAEQERLKRQQEYDQRRKLAQQIDQSRREHETLIDGEFQRRATDVEALRELREQIEAARIQEKQLEKQALAAQAQAKAAPEYMRSSGLQDALQAHLRITNAPPDLQLLVAAHGGYDRITPEAWVKFDADLAAWKQRLRERHLQLS